MKINSLIMLMTALAGCGLPTTTPQQSHFPIRLITLDPGHFHAALVQKSGHPDIDTNVYVYAPPGKDLQSHLSLIDKYNTRNENQTHWHENVYQGADYLSRMLRDKAGNVVVIAGNNQKKIGYIAASIDSGLNVFSDKPMIIEPHDLPRLKEAFVKAGKNRVVLYDIMTERYQITNILQRALSGIPEVFGTLQQGTEKEPAVTKESVHYFFKYVSGKPLVRPAWYYDVAQEGEGLVDVTTHLVDLIQWECFPDKALDFKKDITMLSARRWPTVLTPADFFRSTGLDKYPASLVKYVKDSLLSVSANGEMNYTIKGVHAKVSVRWDFMTPEGTGDTHYSLMHGTLANLVIRQGQEEQYKPVLYIEPLIRSLEFEQHLQSAITKLNNVYPGLLLERRKNGWKVIVPEKFNLDHEATFAEVTKKYLGFITSRNMPAWEVPNMLAKYYTTTSALEMARKNQK